LKLPFFGAFSSDNIVEARDSAAIKTIETASVTKPKMVKLNIKKTEVSFFRAAVIL